MDIHLPIAEASASIYTLLLLGTIVGIMSGLFGLGGNFLLIPALIIIGIPPNIALPSAVGAAIAPSLISSMSGFREKKVDPNIFLYISAGSIVGIMLGSKLVTFLVNNDLFDSLLPLIHFFILSFISIATLSMSIKTFLRCKNHLVKSNISPPKWVEKLPLKKYYTSIDAHISTILILFCGLIAGLLTSSSGVGGGFILLPSLVHILRIPISQAIALTACATLVTLSLTSMMHSYTLHTLDIVLAVIMSISGIFSVKIGRFIQPKLSAEQLNFLFALITLAMATKLAFQMTLDPVNRFSISILK